jgi:hypothetical protein
MSILDEQDPQGSKFTRLPGKGVITPLNTAHIELLRQVSEDLAKAEGEASSLGDFLSQLGELGWNRTADTYGDKAYVEVVSDKSRNETFRYTVVLKNNTLTSDLRRWYTP